MTQRKPQFLAQHDPEKVLPAFAYNLRMHYRARRANS